MNTVSHCVPTMPRDILTKRGNPTAREWTLLRAHPDASRTLLEPLEQWARGMGGCRHRTHERVDGRGYPNGLVGEEISMAGRVVAVADAFDCIVSVRAYKTAVPVEAALAEIRDGSGSQFDAKIVRALQAAAPTGPTAGDGRS